MMNIACGSPPNMRMQLSGGSVSGKLDRVQFRKPQLIGGPLA